MKDIFCIVITLASIAVLRYLPFTVWDLQDVEYILRGIAELAGK